MNKYVLFFSIILSTASTFAIGAEENITGVVTRTITGTGCHLNGTTCYINVNEAVGLTGQCKGTSVRWKKDASNGKEILAMFLAAQMASKQVTLFINNECFAGAGNYPTFSYMTVKN
jgi:hypothetical protein